jgi:hypothetical protein
MLFRLFKVREKECGEKHFFTFSRVCLKKVVYLRLDSAPRKGRVWCV